MNLGQPRELFPMVLVQSVIELEVGCRVLNWTLNTPNHQVHKPCTVSTSLSVNINLNMHCSLLPHEILKI